MANPNFGGKLTMVLVAGAVAFMSIVTYEVNARSSNDYKVCSHCGQTVRDKSQKGIIENSIDWFASSQKTVRNWFGTGGKSSDEPRRIFPADTDDRSDDRKPEDWRNDDRRKSDESRGFWDLIDIISGGDRDTSDEDYWDYWQRYKKVGHESTTDNKDNIEGLSVDTDVDSGSSTNIDNIDSTDESEEVKDKEEKVDSNDKKRSDNASKGKEKKEKKDYEEYEPMWIKWW